MKGFVIVLSGIFNSIGKNEYSNKGERIWET